MTARHESTTNEALLMLAVLKRIPYNRSISTTTLAQELKESGLAIAPRRLQRILKRLSLAEDFAVVCDDRARPYGYRRLLKDSDLEATRLHPEESLVLRLAQEHLKHLFPAPVTESLRPIFDQAGESLKELPAADPAADWLQKVAVVPASLPVMPAIIRPRIFQAVSRALWRNTKLDIEYENGNGNMTRGTVSPLGLVQQGERSYLVCIFDGYEDIRHLALHRLHSATTLEFSADRPADFSLKAYVASRHFNYSNGQKVRLVLEFSDEWLKRYLTETPFNPSQVMTKLSDGTCRVEAVMDDTVLIDAWIAAWSAQKFRRIERTAIAEEPSVENAAEQTAAHERNLSSLEKKAGDGVRRQPACGTSENENVEARASIIA